MGVSTTSYKVIDGIVYVRRGSVEDWEQLKHQYELGMNEMLNHTFANTSYETWNNGAMSAIDWYIEASSNMLEAYKAVGLAIGKIIGM